MTEDIVVPVTAPGSQQAAVEMLKAADAARKLAAASDMVIASGNRASGVFSRNNTVLAQLTQSVNAASRAASIQATGGSAGLGGGGIEGGFHLNHGTESRLIRLIGMAGAGEMSHAIHSTSMAIRLLGPVLGAFGAGILLAGVGISKLNDSEKEKMDQIEKEIKAGKELTTSLDDAARAQGSKASGTNRSLASSRRFLHAATGDDSVDAQIEKYGDPAVYKSLANFLKSKSGQNTKYYVALEAAEKVAATGATDVAGALDEFAKSKKGIIDVNRTVANLFGRKGGGSDDFTQQMTYEERQYDRSNATIDEQRRKTGQELMRQSRDQTLVEPAVRQEMKDAFDPVRETFDKWNIAQLEAIGIMNERAAAEGDLMLILKEFKRLTIGGEGSEGRKVDKALGEYDRVKVKKDE